MAHPPLCEEDSKSPPRWLLTAAHIAVHQEGESLQNTRRSRPSPLRCWCCWRALPEAINNFMKSLQFADHHPIMIGDERERLVTASPVMTKSRAPAEGNKYLENGLVKPPRRDTRALSPAGMFRGDSPLRLAAQKSRPHAPSVPMRIAPAYFLCKSGV
jgi:hypothetical protein